jgi:Stage II sporulation protein E (SpoIIE)
MNPKLQKILDIIQQNGTLSEEKKQSALKAIKDADKELEITAFKLERTEKVKKTTAILLEETIEELEQKRKAVEEQNRELEIESSLERVRTVAMGMNKSDDLLKICEVTFSELQKLGFDNIRNVVIHIPNDEQQYLMDYDYSEFTGGEISKVEYGLHPIIDEYRKKMKSAEDALFEGVLSKDQLDGWKALRKSVGQIDDTRLDETDALYYYLFSIDKGDIGISTFKPISESQIKILKRFRNVFDLAYRRYNDITLAEAQAREAKIEAALERIRSRAMGMHKSEEVGDVSDILFSEFNKLNLEVSGCSIIVIDEEEDKMELWRARSNVAVKPFERSSYNKSMKILKKHMPDFYKKFFTALQERENYLIAEFEGERHLNYINVISEIYNYSTTEKSELIKIAPEKIIAHYIFSNLGYLAIISEKELSEENLSIAKRFIESFDFAYTRFLDIQKAEEQAREAQIELGLERVRARAMAMQKSDELSDLVDTVFKELTKLDFALSWCFINIIDESSLTNIVWAANPNIDKAPDSYYMKFEDYPFHDAMMRGYTDRETKFIYVIEGNEKKVYDEYLFKDTEFRKVPAEAQEASRAMEKYVCSFSFSNFGGLQTVGEKPLTDDNLDILARFGKVFDLTYTRFNDLKQAEEQAREAQIEAALERVRSRTMGMQKSEELKEVIQVVYQQLVYLKINVDHAGFVVDYTPKGDWHFWIADQQEIPSKITHPYFDSVWAHQFDEAKEKGIDFFATNLNFEEKNKFYNELLSYVHGLPEESKDFYLSCPGLAGLTVLFDNVSLYIENFSGIPYSDEENKILMRFGKVFQQTYTRFLDLKKAEAQAREAQIETALERVRSRTMAMQNSEELGDVAIVLFKELNQLVDNLWTCGFVLCEKDRDEDEWWLSTEDGFIPAFYLPNVGDKTHENIYNAWKRGETYHTEQLEGNDLTEHYEWLMNIPISRKIFEDMEAAGMERPSWQKLHCAFFSSGYLVMITRVPCPEEAIFNRFAQVFDQTYTRFLDLQKAEAQAREAQIEAALERVRSKTMAMHNSEELADLSLELVKQVQALGVATWFCAFNIYDDDPQGSLEWGSNGEGTFPRYRTPREGIFLGYYEAGQRGETLFINEIGANECPAHYDYLCTLPGVGEQLLKMKESGISFPTSQIDHVAYFKYGYIIFITFEPAPEAHNIFKRFAKVFEQTYTRFLDLQYAEAQAREAQIEAALERIRGQVTAMQESTELLDIVVKMRTEFVSLGHEAHYFWYMRYLPEIYEKAMTSGDGTRIGMIMTLPRHIHGDIKLLADWEKSKEPAVVFPMDVDTAVDYVDKMINLGDFVQVDHNAPTLDDIRHIGGLTFVMARTHHGEIGFSLPGTIPDPPQESLDTLVRFAGVFDLAYSRFEDLKDAEQRNRETQIELALERVRARTMAMQKSNELAQTAANLFEQMETLGIKPYRCNIAIVDAKHKKLKLWSTTNHGNVIPVGSDIPFNENGVFKEMYNGWKKQKKNHSIKLVGEDRVNWTKYISKYVPFDEYKTKNFNNSKLMKEAAIFNNFYFRQGYFVIHTKEEISDEDFDIIQRFANVFEQTYTRFLDLENAEYQNKIIQAENERKTQELEEARQLQLAMLPKELPNLPNLDIAVYMQTATEVGGDYYDFQVGIDGMLTTVIGDATGHGMKAGTVVTITKSLFNSMAANENILSTFDKISEVIKGMKFRQLAMCLIMMKIKGNRLSMSSAAMPPAYIYRKKDKTVEEILLKGMPLGSMKKFPYKKAESHLNIGDRILLYSDGLPELANDSSEMYGYEKIKTEFQSVGEKEPEEIVDHLKNSASQWANGNVPDDDVTFVVIKVK